MEIVLARDVKPWKIALRTGGEIVSDNGSCTIEYQQADIVWRPPSHWELRRPGFGVSLDAHSVVLDRRCVTFVSPSPGGPPDRVSFVRLGRHQLFDISCHPLRGGSANPLKLAMDIARKATLQFPLDE